jgi:hypothetical protein
LTGANHSRCRAWSTRGRSSRFPSAISVTSSPGVAAFVSLTMVVEPGGELVSWPRWSLLISSLRPMDRPVKTRGLVDDDDGGRTWRGGRRFTPAPGGFGGPAPPMALDFVDWHFGFVASGLRRIFRTRDDGRSWERLRFACPHDEYLGGLAFASRLGGPTLLDTADVDSVMAMSWPSPRVGHALLFHRGLIRTVDGGRHWRRP